MSFAPITTVPLAAVIVPSELVLLPPSRICTAVAEELVVTSDPCRMIVPPLPSTRMSAEPLLISEAPSW